jgi:anaerobic selenocysteine-containing dehydrogenase
LKEEKQQINEEQKKSREVSRRDFLVGAGTVVAGGVIGAGLLSSCDGGETQTGVQTTTKTIPTTITAAATTVTETVTTQIGDGVTVTATKTITEPGGSGVIEPAYEEEVTYYKNIAPSGTGGDPVAIDAKNGKVVRIRQYIGMKRIQMQKPTNVYGHFSAKGKTLSCQRRSFPSYFGSWIQKASIFWQ